MIFNDPGSLTPGMALYLSIAAALIVGAAIIIFILGIRTIESRTDLRKWYNGHRAYIESEFTTWPFKHK